MNTHAAGGGGNPLHWGVGSPIHTPTHRGGDWHTFIPFTSQSLLTPLSPPLWFLPPHLIRNETKQRLCAWKNRKGKRAWFAPFVPHKWTTRGSVQLRRASFRWSQDVVGVSHEGKAREKQQSESRQWALQVALCAVNKSSSDRYAADQYEWDVILKMRLMINRVQWSSMNLQSKHAQFALCEQTLYYYCCPTSQQ